MTILETISPDTLVFLQTHKRIWPASQRDALFWSHMRRVSDGSEDPDTHDAWIVCNHSTEHETYPVKNLMHNILEFLFFLSGKILISFCCFFSFFVL